MRSMTGFGRGESTAGGWRIGVELSGVNRKQADFSIHLPGALAEFETEVRQRLGEAVSRGRITVRVDLETEEKRRTSLSFDRTLAERYVEAARSLAEIDGVEIRIAAADLFRAPGVFALEETVAETDDVREPFFDALGRAIAGLTAMQSAEGDHIRRDLIQRLELLLASVAAVRERAPLVPKTYRESLLRRLEDAGLEIGLGDERVLREIALFAERCDISEEIVRIDSHATQFRDYLETDGPSGRPLDFLCQEFHRELNTIGSKANDSLIAQRIVEAKTELEKIREQVQNVQ